MSAIEALRAARDLGVELTSREGVAIPQDSTGQAKVAPDPQNAPLAF